MQEIVLYVDQGNTRAKFWLVSAGQVMCRGMALDAADLQEQLGGHCLTNIVLATVKPASGVMSLLGPWLEQVPEPVMVKVCEAVLPTAYEDVTKLGIDRWLGVLAARALGHGAALVVDAGTAITLDVLTKQGEHAGGYILPGLSMQQASLALSTAQVRFPESAWGGQTLGTNTAEAVGHGSVRAVCALVREMDNELQLEAFSRLYLTGGNARDLAPFLPSAHVVEDLLLIGMQAYMQSTSLMARTVKTE